MTHHMFQQNYEHRSGIQHATTAERTSSSRRATQYIASISLDQISAATLRLSLSVAVSSPPFSEKSPGTTLNFWIFCAFGTENLVLSSLRPPDRYSPTCCPCTCSRRSPLRPSSHWRRAPRRPSA